MDLSPTLPGALDALEYLSNHAGNFPQVIFVDINTPQMKGFDFIREYQRLFHLKKANCKIVVLSSSDFHGDIEEASKFDSGTLYIRKPLTFEKLRCLQPEIKFKGRPAHWVFA